MAGNSTSTQAKTTLSQTNPALKALQVLVGEWEMELSNASFLPRPTDTVKGLVSFEWVQDGAFLVMRKGDKPPGSPAALWLISRDEVSPDYSVCYYDSRSVSRIYGMSFSDGVWKMWRNAPGFCQRYEGTVDNNSNIVTARWEKSGDGATWEHDFNVLYTRIS